MRRLAFVFVLAVLAPTTSAWGAPITTAATDLGWYLQRSPVGGGSPTYLHQAFNQSFAAGTSNVNLPTFLDEYRSFFVFDLSGVTTPVTSGVLRLQSYTYDSVDATETYTLYDVSTPISSLTAGGSAVGPIFADLGTGTPYGSRVYSAADGGLYRDITLNADAIAAINANLGGSLAIGGAVTTLSFATGPGAGSELLFANYSSSFDQFLVLDPVPEPSTALLLGLGVAGLAAWRRRRAA